MKKSKIKRTLISLISMVVVTSLFSINCFAYTGFTYTPLRGQETNDWCWAASDQMLLETQGIYYSQSDIAGDIEGGASVYQARARLEACSPDDMEWDLYNRVLSFDSVENTIDSGWAIFIACTTGYSGHAMVITGYDRNPAGYNNVWLQDPWGDDESAPHDGEEGWCNYASPVLGEFAGTGTILEQCEGLRWFASIC